MNRLFCTGSLVFFVVQGAEPDALCCGDKKKKQTGSSRGLLLGFSAVGRPFHSPFLPHLLLKMETENKLKHKGMVLY